MNSEDFNSRKFPLRALGETKGRPGDRREVWRGTEDVTSVSGQKPTEDMSSKEAHFTFSNISTVGHVKSDRQLCWLRNQGGSTLFLPPSDQQVWVESPIPASPALAPCTSHTAGNLHTRRLLQTEREGDAAGTGFEQEQCGPSWHLQQNKKKMLSMGEGTGTLHANTASKGGLRKVSVSWQP